MNMKFSVENIIGQCNHEGPNIYVKYLRKSYSKQEKKREGNTVKTL